MRPGAPGLVPTFDNNFTVLGGTRSRLVDVEKWVATANDRFTMLGDTEISWSLLAALDSKVPAFQDSKIPGLQDSRIPRIPGLQDSRVPGLQDSSTAGLQDSKNPVSQENLCLGSRAEVILIH